MAKNREKKKTMENSIERADERSRIRARVRCDRVVKWQEKVEEMDRAREKNGRRVSHKGGDSRV